MNPSASVFTPGPTPLPEAAVEELRSVNQSLCKALAEARQAQNAIKSALEEETAKRARAEEEIKSLLKTNSSLASTAQMLGAIIKYNINTPNLVTAVSEAGSAGLSQENSCFHVKKSDSLPNTLAPNPVVTADGGTIHTTHSILYDVLEHQRSQYQQAGYPESEEDLANITPTSSTVLEGPQDIEMTDTVESTPKVSQGVHPANDVAIVSQGRANHMLTGTTAALESFGLRQTTNQSICMPYKCRPNWAISQNRPLFDNDQELARARRLCGGPLRLSTFWQHPVRYLPASDEKNLCRTLIIDFLPLDTTVKDVLALIHGGALESVQLFESIGIATDFKTARVVFHHEIPACDMYAHWQKYGMTMRGQPIRVLQLGYTYPKTRQLDEDVFIRCYTRILLIDNINNRIVQRLPAYLNQQIKMGFIIEIGQADDGIAMIEFTSVVEAAKAMRAMQTEQMFHGAIFDFEDDYCEEGTYAY